MIEAFSRAVVQKTEEARSFQVRPLEEILIKISSEQTNGKYSIMELRTGPDAGTPLHLHQREDEIFEILEGRFRFSLDGDIVEATAGTTVLVPQNMPHWWRSVGEGSGRIILTFVPGGMEKLFEEVAAIPNDHLRIAQLAEQYGTVVLGPPL